MGVEKRAAYRDWTYWARPVPNFGEAPADLLVVGLAPAAHGANRTGRMFTGDRSGDWLYRALFKAGFANRARAEHRADGLQLFRAAITAVCHCAPPQNRPTPEEISHCREYLQRTLLLVQPRVIVALGAIAWRETGRALQDLNWLSGKLCAFRHGAHVALPHGRRLLASYHPSQQNTFTGRLTEAMFDAVFRSARNYLVQATQNAL